MGSSNLPYGLGFVLTISVSLGDGDLVCVLANQKTKRIHHIASSGDLPNGIVTCNSVTLNTGLVYVANSRKGNAPSIAC